MFALTDATDLKTSGSLDTDIARNGQVLHLGGTLRCQNGRRWQWERQKSNSLNRQNNNSARAARFFVHLFTVTARLRPENAFYGGRKQATAKFLSLCELECGSQEFGSKRVRLHLKKISLLSWSNHDRDWKNPNSLVKRSFRGRRRRGILNSLITPMKVIHYLTGKEGGWGRGAPWRSYLSHTHCFLIPHNLEIPEERTTTSLTDITLRPFWCLIQRQKKKEIKDTLLLSLILSFQGISLTEHLSLNNRLILYFLDTIIIHNTLQFPALSVKKEQAISLCRLFKHTSCRLTFMSQILTTPSSLHDINFLACGA